ncbi:MAG: substrate binding domain-containing protein, partial [Pseudomonas sp.]
EVGQAYYERCRQIMLDFAEAEQAVMQLQLQPSGLLRITAPIEFGQLLLGRVLGEFMREYPQITAEVELTSRKVDPLEEAVDIAIQVGQPQDSTLIARCLLSSGRSLCASPDYLAQHGAPQTVAELAGHRAILLPQDPPRYWPVQGESIACQRVLACNNITFAREAALAGAGIVGLPHMICREALKDGRLLELLPQACLPTSEIYALYPSRRFQAMKVKAFLDFLISRLPAEVGPLLEP